MSEYHCVNVSAPSHLSYTTASVSLVFSLITIPGNLLVCLAVFIDPNKNLRNPFNYFVVNLAIIADLIVGCVTEPISVYVHVKEGHGIPLAQVDIWSIHVSYFIACTASVLNISLLAFERYLAITYPVKYRLLFSLPRFLTLASTIWVVSIALSIIYFFTTYILYAFVFINIAVVWTLGVSAFTYIKILGKLKSGIRRSIRSSVPTMQQMESNDSSNLTNRQLTKAYLIIVFAFLGCYLPAYVIIYALTFCKERCSCSAIHYMRDIQFIIVIFNSAINPIVYAYRFEKFRHAIVDIVSGCCKNKPMRLKA